MLDDIQPAMPVVKDMSNMEGIQMLQRCSEEIRMLRVQRDNLAPKAEAYDLINKIVGLMPTQGRGYGEDILWKLEKRIAELQSIIVKKG